MKITNVVRNSAECGYTEPDADCELENEGNGYGTVPIDTTPIDDGCVPGVDEHCPIEDTSTPTTPATGGTDSTVDPGGDDDSVNTNNTTPPITTGGYGGGTRLNPVHTAIFNNFTAGFGDNNPIVRPSPGG